ncbi:NAD(P)H-dependent oxidoreductase [Enterobacter bugandensis]|uniref:NAD(P)H-dependent oxidoreductase n=1 Tax=Enterobacteriaceae TaxID=543 RepID=UPI001889BE4A|nr:MULTISPECIES: NAD(P)H-dependent oxidoreductase [Enterobacteriaceae]MBF2751093.1 NAD(P)H-dependent oxidoreductase [Enterobacter bugandensis]MBF2803798.1 NAD(P)H-dependent oxidoreductase [Enterobacter bugandensis]MDX7584799.1 NAD(P)H-dependent oxidoreductase [Klebsiella pneumoniae]
MIIVVVAHPNLEESILNKSLVEKLLNEKGIEVLDLYERYRHATYNGLPDDKLEEDRQKLLTANTIVLQFPFYWYSTPSLLKQWIDDILLSGWAHHGGVEGKDYALACKSLLLAPTTGGSKSSYGPEGYNMYWFYDFMVPFVQTARTCKMRFIDPYVIYADQFKPTETPNEYVEFIRSIGQ